MTAKEFYKKTSDMSYHITVAQPIEGEDVIVGKIGFTEKNREDAIRLLKENNFFAVDCNTDGIDLNNVSLIIEFHYGIDRWDAFMMEVCDTIDCRSSGGKLVLSCTDKFELIKEVFPKPEEKEEKEEVEEKKNCVYDVTKHASIFDAFDELIKFPAFPEFPRFPDFPKFPDFNTMVENTKKTFENIRKAASDSNDGNTKFYDFSCKIDPDGNVSMKRTTNDGTIEKKFKIGDEKANVRKIDVKDDVKPSDSVNRLKDIL